ncbi:MAG: hypothetical protein HY543_01470 [Deltaproteobacteria bacterium]|nr:hypothetical protein [Deltaproteobacteria bacterium]
MQSDHDTLALSGTKVGDDTVPAFGFFFGWNVTDAAAVELVGRYGTAKTFGVREHVIRLGAHARWHWIADALTDAGRWRLLPFVHAGPLLEMTLLPGDPAVAETRVTQWGAGLSAGGGLNLLLYDAAYLTFIGQTDLVHRLGVSRNIGAIPTEIYRGGWDAGWSALAGVGVHY